MTQEDGLEAPLPIHFSTRSILSPTGIYIYTPSDDVAALHEKTVLTQKLLKIELARNQRVLMRRAWESWNLTLADLHLQSYILDQTAISVKMVGMRMNVPSQECANDARVSLLNKYILELMFLKLLHNTFSAAFDQWRFWGTKRKIASKKLLKFVRGWLTSRAAGILSLWHQYVADVLRDRSVMTRRMLCCERRFKRVRCATFSLILQCWLKNVTEAKQSRNNGFKVLQRLSIINRTPLPVFQHWRQKVTEKRRRRLWLTSITCRIVNSALARALDTWHQSVSNNRSKIQHTLKTVIVSSAASLPRNHRSGKDARLNEIRHWLKVVQSMPPSMRTTGSGRGSQEGPVLLNTLDTRCRLSRGCRASSPP
jgi:hypothetical protein